jgi:hypothetical protein
MCVIVKIGKKEACIGGAQMIQPRKIFVRALPLM